MSEESEVYVDFMSGPGTLARAIGQIYIRTAFWRDRSHQIQLELLFNIMLILVGFRFESDNLVMPRSSNFANRTTGLCLHHFEYARSASLNKRITICSLRIMGDDVILIVETRPDMSLLCTNDSVGGSVLYGKECSMVWARV